MPGSSNNIDGYQRKIHFIKDASHPIASQIRTPTYKYVHKNPKNPKNQNAINKKIVNNAINTNKTGSECFISFVDVWICIFRIQHLKI